MLPSLTNTNTLRELSACVCVCVRCVVIDKREERNRGGRGQGKLGLLLRARQSTTHAVAVETSAHAFLSLYSFLFSIFRRKFLRLFLYLKLVHYQSDPFEWIIRIPGTILLLLCCCVCVYTSVWVLERGPRRFP